MLNRFFHSSSLTPLTVGSREYFAAQRKLILSRRALKWCYDQWYARLIADVRSAPPGGIVLELGSGGSYLKQIEPSIVTSDVTAGVADTVIDGRCLPFADRSISALLLTHVLHHIPDVDRFFREADRTLMPGGVISMIEVAHTPFARYFFRNFHPEPYQDDRTEWSFEQTDAMMDSNQALSWMVFVRDRRIFEQRYPGLTIEALSYLPWFSYLAAGGVTGVCLSPGILGYLPPLIEFALRPLTPLFALHWHIRVRKAA